MAPPFLFIYLNPSEFHLEMTSCFFFFLNSQKFSISLSSSPTGFPFFVCVRFHRVITGRRILSSVLLLLLLLCQENGDEKEPYQTRDSAPNKRGRKSRSFFCVSTREEDVELKGRAAAFQCVCVCVWNI